MKCPNSKEDENMRKKIIESKVTKAEGTQRVVEYFFEGDLASLTLSKPDVSNILSIIKHSDNSYIVSELIFEE